MDTLAAHAGDDPFSFMGAASPPIFETSTFVFPSVADAIAAFADEQEHYVYTRRRNPTVRVVEEKLAAMEGAEACRLFGMGMAAISAVILVLCAGRRPRGLRGYGLRSGGAFITGYLSPASACRPRWWTGAIPPNGRPLCGPTPACSTWSGAIVPHMKLQDLAAVTAVARRHGIVTIIDNSYATMLLQRPMELGVDLVVYSGSKYFGGQSDVLAGAILGSAERLRRIGETEYPLLGGIIGPFEAWLIGRGLRTLPVRMRQQDQVNAAKVAEFLAGHPRVARIHYPGHPSHPQYELGVSDRCGGHRACSPSSWTPGTCSRVALRGRPALLQVRRLLGRDMSRWSSCRSSAKCTRRPKLSGPARALCASMWVWRTSPTSSWDLDQALRAM